MSRHGPDPRRMALLDLEHAAKDAANRPEILAIAAELGGTEQMRTEAAGLAIGAYLANPFMKYRNELLAAALLVAAGPIDHKQLDRWMREGFLRVNGGAQSDPERLAWFRVLNRP